MQVNRKIRDNPALDDVDHALGRPFDPWDTYRDHYATCCPDQISKMRKSPWWDQGAKDKHMTFFRVSSEGRRALQNELADREKYGRLFRVSSRDGEGSRLVMAATHAKAKYAAWLNSEIDDPFHEFAARVSVRLA